MVKTKAERRAAEKEKRRRARQQPPGSSLPSASGAPGPSSPFPPKASHARGQGGKRLGSNPGGQIPTSRKRRLLNTARPSAVPLRLQNLPTPTYSASSSSTGPFPPKNGVYLHRCRFLDFVPGSVTALTVTPSTWDPSELSPSFTGSPEVRGAVALGRGNGDVEVWAWGGRQGWILHQHLPGHIPADGSGSGGQGAPKIEHLIWVHQTELSGESKELLDEGEEQEGERKRLKLKRPRLLGSCGSEEVLEWEWNGGTAGRLKRTLALPAMTTIWSMALSPDSGTLALGCEDGAIRLVSLWDDSLALIRSLDPCRSRLLSVAWGSTLVKGKGKARSEETEEWIVAGCGDSSLRKWDLKSGRSLGRMAVDKLKGEQTLVWTVGYIAGNIIAGDSMGNVTVWDPRLLTQIQIIRAHRADILCLVPSPDGRTFFTAGVDQKTCQIALSAAKNRWVLTAGRKLHSHDVRALAVSPPYSPSASFKAAYQMPILLSGGLDMSLVLCPAVAPSALVPSLPSAVARRKNPISDSPSVMFSDAIHRKVTYAPQRDGVIGVANRARLLALKGEAGLTVWRAPPLELWLEKGRMGHEVDAQAEEWNKVLELDLKCSTNLIASSISPDGRYLAASDLYSTKLFSLESTSSGLSVHRMKSFASALQPALGLAEEGASRLVFSPDSRRLVVGLAGSARIVVVGLPKTGGAIREGEVEVLKVFDQHREVDRPFSRVLAGPKRAANGHAKVNGKVNGEAAEDSEEDEEMTSEREEGTEAEAREGGFGWTKLAGLSVSRDGQWLASVDLARRINIFNLDALQYHCSLPTPEHVATSLAFLPSSPSILLVGFPNNSIQIFDVESRKVADWARTLSTHPPKGLANLRDPLIGMAFNPTHHVSSGASSSGMTPRGSVGGSPVSWERDAGGKEWEGEAVILWGATWVCKLTLAKPPTSFKSATMGRRPSTFGAGSKRSRNGEPIAPGKPTFRGPINGSPTPSSHSLLSASPSTPRQLSRPGSTTLRVTHKYQPILGVDFLKEGEMIVVEQPFAALLDRLPPAWQRTGQYGT